MPRALRFPLTRDNPLRLQVLGILVRSIFALQRCQARQDGFEQNGFE